MKPGIHPEYMECTVRCSCGNTFVTRSTVPEIRVELCNECHPFYTGQQKFVDTGGRVQRFADKFGGAAQAALEREAAKKAERAKKAEEEQAKKAAEREAKAAEKAKRAAKFEAEAAKKAEEAAKAEAAEAEAVATEVEAATDEPTAEAETAAAAE